jgi:type II secretory pathway pseudopilin PulG
MGASHQHEFTPVELIIVVAVIGLLAALILPSWSARRERSRLATFANNLKQLARSNLSIAELRGRACAGYLHWQPVCVSQPRGR